MFIFNRKAKAAMEDIGMTLSMNRHAPYEAVKLALFRQYGYRFSVRNSHEVVSNFFESNLRDLRNVTVECLFRADSLVGFVLYYKCAPVHRVVF